MLSQGNLQYFHSEKKRYFFMVPIYSIKYYLIDCVSIFIWYTFALAYTLVTLKNSITFIWMIMGHMTTFFSKNIKFHSITMNCFLYDFFIIFLQTYFCLFTITIALFSINNYLHQQCYYQQLSCSVITRNTNYYRLSIYGCLIQILYC